MAKSRINMSRINIPFQFNAITFCMNGHELRFKKKIISLMAESD